MKKVLLGFILGVLLIFGGINVFADDAIYEQKKEETIAPGVTLTRVNAFYSGYNLTYSYVTADLTQESCDLTLLKSNDGINVRDTVANLAKTEKNVVAAINADFFSMTQNSFSQGIEYKNGKILQSPIDTKAFAGGFLYDNNKLVLSNIGFKVMVVAPNLNYREVYRINKPMDAFGELLMYTSDYNKDSLSPAPGNGVVEMLVVDGVVEQFNETTTPIKIPENGYVLEISAAVPFLKENFKIGDSVKVEKYINPTLDNLKIAFGGGSLLLKDGALCEFTNNITGYNPRSAVGTNAEKNKVYLMCVDGRQSSSKGVTQTQLADIMKKIGCTDALNLDGGGSSNMVSKTWDNNALSTVNSPTENRKVINAIGIIDNTEKDGRLAYLNLEADTEVIFTGSNVNFKLSGADKSYSHVDIDVSSAVFNNERVKNMKFSETQAGVYEVYAQIGNVRSNSVYITVISDIAGIRVAPVYKLANVGDSSDMYISVYDEKGNYVGAWYSEFEISIIGDAAEFENGKVIAKKNGEAIVKISRGNVKAYTKVCVGSNYEERAVRPSDVVSDSKNKKIDDADKVFAYAALADTQTTLYDALYTKRLADILTRYDRVAILGNQVHSDFDSIYAVNYDKYMCLRKDWAVFLSLPAKNGSIRSADAEAFNKIRSDLKMSAEPNVFVTCDTYLNMSGTEFEALKSVLKETGKNVFVIQRADANSVRIVDGIHFFTIADNKGLSNLTERVSESKILKFYVKGIDVTYSFEKVY